MVTQQILGYYFGAAIIPSRVVIVIAQLLAQNRLLAQSIGISCFQILYSKLGSRGRVKGVYFQINRN